MNLLYPVIPAQAGMILAQIQDRYDYDGYPCTSGDDPEKTQQ